MMKTKLFAMTAAMLIGCSALPVPAWGAGEIVLEESVTDLSAYTTNYDALAEADTTMFAGNQALLTLDLMVQINGCVITPDIMEWEVIGGTADVTIESDSFSKTVSYEQNYANSYCLVTAESPGTVCIRGTEINGYTNEEMIELYWNLNITSEGVFDGTVSHEPPVTVDPANTCTLTIDQLPDKVSYQIGEELDLTGAIVSLNYQSVFTGDVVYEQVPLTEYADLFQINDSAFDSSTSGTYTIYITYMGAHTSGTASFTVEVEEPTYPESFDEYTALLEECPEFYRNDGDSVYFLNHSISSMEMGMIVSGNGDSGVEENTYGYIFRPEEDGRYFVTVREDCEGDYTSGSEGDLVVYDPMLYPEFYYYTVDVKDGRTTVTYCGMRSWKNEVSYDSSDLLDGIYFSTANGYLADDTYITTWYGPYEIQSYFCLTLPYQDLIGSGVRAETSDNTVAYCDMECYVSSAVYTDDIWSFCRVIAAGDGDVTITADDTLAYALTVENGVFRFAGDPASVVAGDVNNDTIFTIVDVISLQKYLTSGTAMAVSQNADFTADGIVNAFDLCIMKRELLKANEELTPLLMIDDYQITMDENGWGSERYIEIIDSNGLIHTEYLGQDVYDLDIAAYADAAETFLAKEITGNLAAAEIDELSAFSANAAGYADTAMTAMDFGVADYGQEDLYALYPDGNGGYEAVLLCQFGGECAWLNDPEVQELVTMLIRNGHYADAYMFEFYLDTRACSH